MAGNPPVTDSKQVDEFEEWSFEKVIETLENVQILFFCLFWLFFLVDFFRFEKP